MPEFSENGNDLMNVAEIDLLRRVSTQFAQGIRYNGSSAEHLARLLVSEFRVSISNESSLLAAVLPAYVRRENAPSGSAEGELICRLQRRRTTTTSCRPSVGNVIRFGDFDFATRADRARAAHFTRPHVGVARNIFAARKVNDHVNLAAKTFLPSIS